ncbi:MAG: hypothetical protein BGO05_15985 [Rhizobiales bacterium 63-7]|nr:hypothetical protein [Hyphomicrobiales bacterium]OJU69540.1 MAG: hypothetical protein BGO05_15985 [Rhizobiales bacterium 63-7]
MKPNTVPAGGEAVPRKPDNAAIAYAALQLQDRVHNAMMFARVFDDFLSDRTIAVAGTRMELSEDDIDALSFLSNQSRMATYDLSRAYEKAMGGEAAE